MAVNLKIASVVIATLAITFSSFTLVKLTINYLPNNHNSQEAKVIDNGDVNPKFESGKEPWAADAKISSTPTTFITPTKADRYAELTAKLNHNPHVSEIWIVIAFLSIVSSFMIFGAVSDNNDHNQLKRHMLVPFMVYHSLLCAFIMSGIIYICVKHYSYMDILLFPVLIYTSVVFVIVVGICFIYAYHKSLSRMAGFSYGKMDDDVQKVHDHEVKIPLA